MFRKSARFAFHFFVAVAVALLSTAALAQSDQGQASRWAQKVWLCGCKHSGKRPFCDGTHQKVT